VSRVILALVLAAFLAGTLAGCGRKGDPEVPKGDTDTLRQQYPKPDAQH
jgi:predicted small lipoprotein YifL